MRLRSALLALGLLVACGSTGERGDGGAFGEGGDAASAPGDAGTGGPADSDPDSGGPATGASDEADATGASEGGPVGSSGPAGSTDGGETQAGDETESSGDGSSSETTADTGGGPPDACGFDSDGIWIEFEYSQAGVSAQSPGWAYSATPGWGSAQWAAQGENWPEVWDVWNNINVVTDPIGVVAAVGPSGELQLMIGLQDLSDYDHATACIEGRSVSTSASVIFDAYNPLNGCGASVTMAHDWSVHAEGVDLGDCFEPGGGVQALRLEPTGGSSSLGVTRVRLTLHGAVY